MTILGEILGIFIPNSEFRTPNYLSFPPSCIFALVLRPDSPIPLGLKQGNSGINM